MADQIAVVTKTVSGSPPFTIDFTDPSITETFSAAILIFSSTDTDNSDIPHGIMGIGFVAPDGGATTEEGTMCAHSQDGQNTTPNCNTRHSNVACVSVGDPTLASAGGATALLLGVYSSSIAGGVRLSFDPGSISVKVTAILFAGLTRAYTDGCTSGTGGVHENVGGTTQFQPDLVIFSSSDAALNSALADAAPNIGFALNKVGIPQVCSYVNADDGTEPSDADGFVRSANAYGHFVAAGSRAGEFSTVTSFDSTGFNHTSTLGTPDAHYLALKFSGPFQMACANLSVAASATAQTFTDFGFVPGLVLGMGTLLTSLDSTTDGPTASCSGFFITGQYASRAITWHHEEGLTLSGLTVANADTRQEDVAVLNYDHQGTIVQRATWGGASGSSGFILNFSTASQAGFLTALGIQLALSPMVISETEAISDSPVLFLNRSLALTETVEISDQFASFTNDVTDTDGPAGTSFSARAERGTSFQGGAEAGTAF